MSEWRSHQGYGIAEGVARRCDRSFEPHDLPARERGRLERGAVHPSKCVPSVMAAGTATCAPFCPRALLPTSPLAHASACPRVCLPTCRHVRAMPSCCTCPPGTGFRMAQKAQAGMCTCGVRETRAHPTTCRHDHTYRSLQGLTHTCPIAHLPTCRQAGIDHRTAQHFDDTPT